mmetsp:Transcript_125797/g.361703  ORF Transcript_125797/g.361703 Transcript_125797/m.361703 type:complete len:1015 (+) Transcript_125797:137-3181(+)
MSCNPNGNEPLELLGALEQWALEYDCPCIDLEDDRQFVAMWGFCLIAALIFCTIVSCPFFPRCLRCCCCRRSRKPQAGGDPEAQRPNSKPRLEGAWEEEDGEDQAEPSIPKAEQHLKRTSATKDGEWRPIWSTALGDMAEIGGTGTELYFRLLRNLGIVFAYMSALTCASIAFNAVSNFAPDNGNALTKTTVGNIGATVQGTNIEPDQRYIILKDFDGKCSGTAVNKMTSILGWLDFSSIALFFVCILVFRFYIVPRVAKQSDDDQITPKDFAVEIDNLPRRFPGMEQADSFGSTAYERQLSELLCQRIRVQQTRERARAGAEAGDAPAVKVEELVLVRDFKGKLRKKKALADLKRELDIAQYIKDEKQVAKLSKRIEKMEKKVNEKLESEDALDVVRAYAILSTPKDAERLIIDYRFSVYGLLRRISQCLGNCGLFECCCPQRQRMFHGRALRIRRAPEPTNIIWENQDVPHVERKVRHALVMFAFLIIVLLSFTLVYLANAAAKSQTKSTTQLLGNDACDPEIGKINPDNTEYLCYVDTALNWTMSFVETATADEKACYCGAIGYANIARSTALINGVCRDWLIAVATGIGIGVCATGIVVVINVVAKMVLIQLSYAEKPLSYSALNAAQMVKIFALQTLNTGFVIFCVNFSPPDWFPLGSLIFLGEFSDSVRGWYVVVGAAIMSNMLANAVTPAASNVCVMIANKFQRWCCSKRQKHQLQLRQLYTNPEFDMAARFAQLLNTVFVTLAYSSGMPLLNAFACMYMFFTFWADKVVLLWGSRRPPAYDTQIPKQAADIMLYAIPLHCFFAVWMMGQPCTFPSNPLGGTLQSLANQGISSAGSTSNFAASDGVLDRGMKESTWMVFALLVLLVAVYILWTVLWILGGTLGEFFKAMFTLCCSRAKRIAPESHVEVQTWAMVKADIARDFPPASYMMEEHPMYKEAAQFMRTRTSFNERKNEKKAAMAPSDSAKTGDGGPDNATAQASNKDANQDAETARDVAADKAPSEARQED